MKETAGKITAKVIKRFIIVFIIALAGLVLFYLYNPKKAITLVFPDLNDISYINTVIKNDSAYTKISMVFQNKNPYKLDIDTLSFKVKLADTIIADQKVSLMLKQSHFDIDTVKVPLNLDIKKIRGLIKSLQDQDSTEIKIEGYAIYETIFGKTKLKFNKDSKISVPVPPEIKVLKVERKSFNYKEKILKANATIEIINKGKTLDLQLTDIHYNITVKNTLHSYGIISKPVSIKPKSSITLTIPIEIEIYHPLKTAWLVSIDKDRLNYSLHVTCNIKENISEKSYTSPAEVRASGILELVK
ncbi:MAG: LEA type 2 family protein [Bacteroidia bacterium]